MNLHQYLTENNLWDFQRLEAHCKEHQVYVISSQRTSPSIVMLHYAEEAHFDQAWTPFNRVCRGVILDLSSREILAYPFPKFFNLGEQPETEYDVLSKLGSFEVAEKLDGSMIIPFYDRGIGKVLATTKGSFDSEHGVVATDLLPFNIQSQTLLQEYTLMFELIDKRFRIVVDYTKKGYEEGLYLIGIRHRPSNRLLSYNEVQQFAGVYGLRTFKTYDFRSLDVLLEAVKTLPVLEEGFVLRFQDGRLVKVKGPAYLQAHKFISHLSPKSILESLQEGTSGELLKIAPEEYREEVQQYIEKFHREKEELEASVTAYFEQAPKETRKDFALWIQKEVPSHLRGLMFTMLDGKPLDRRKTYALIGERLGVSGATKI